MAAITQRPKGTQDVVPNEVYKWHFVENMTKMIAEMYDLAMDKSVDGRTFYYMMQAIMEMFKSIN